MHLPIIQRKCNQHWFRRWLKTKPLGLSASHAQFKHAVLLSHCCLRRRQPQAAPRRTGQVRRFQSQLYVVPEFEDISDWRASLQLSQIADLPNECGQVALFGDENRINAPQI